MTGVPLFIVIELYYPFTIDFKRRLRSTAILFVFFHLGEKFGGKSAMFGNSQKRTRKGHVRELCWVRCHCAVQMGTLNARYSSTSIRCYSFIFGLATETVDLPPNFAHAGTTKCQLPHVKSRGQFLVRNLLFKSMPFT